MPSYNKVVLAGHLTRDPELSFLANQTALCKLGLAVNHAWRDKEGNKKEEVCFVDCCAFGKTAETLNQYLKKGRAILVDGRLRYASWEDKEGKRRSKHEVLIESFQFLGGKGETSGNPDTAESDEAVRQHQKVYPPSESTASGGDIPF